jgi:hypothetical protein
VCASTECTHTFRLGLWAIANCLENRRTSSHSLHEAPLNSVVLLLLFHVSGVILCYFDRAS